MISISTGTILNSIHQLKQYLDDFSGQINTIFNENGPGWHLYDIAVVKDNGGDNYKRASVAFDEAARMLEEQQDAGDLLVIVMYRERSKDA